MVHIKTSFFGFLFLFTTLPVNAHYGPDYTPPVESSRARSLSLQSEQSIASNPYDYLIQSSSGVPRRWIVSDNGSKIKYYLDIEFKPGSFSALQCKDAAIEAFQAWTDICGVDFIFSGFIYAKESLADFFQNNEGFDDSIIIQMHETYTDRTAEDNYLAAASSSRSLTVGSGGKFKGVEFNKSLMGYIYFNHDKLYWYNASFDDLVAVFKHEIGHILGLRHSNYDPSTGEEVHMPVLTEENSYQRQSIMYYQVSDDMDFGQWDTDHIKLLHDKDNHVPFSNSDHGDEALYTPYNSYYSNNNINYFTFDIGDLDSDSVAIIEAPEHNINNNYIDNYFQNPTLELRSRYNLYTDVFASAGASYYRFAYRVQDSVGNLSPIYYVRIKKLLVDRNSNGVSDDWENGYSISPSSRDFDTDGDLVSDYIEYLTDTDPTDENSFNKIIKLGALASNVIENPSEYNLYSMNDIQDLRPGSTMIEVVNNEATIQLKMEESSDLESDSWTEIDGAATMTVPVPADSETKFIRFKMAD